MASPVWNVLKRFREPKFVSWLAPLGIGGYAIYQTRDTIADAVKEGMTARKPVLDAQGKQVYDTYDDYPAIDAEGNPLLNSAGEAVKATIRIPKVHPSLVDTQEAMADSIAKIYGIPEDLTKQLNHRTGPDAFRASLGIDWQTLLASAKPAVTNIARAAGGGALGGLSALALSRLLGASAGASNLYALGGTILGGTGAMLAGKYYDKKSVLDKKANTAQPTVTEEVVTSLILPEYAVQRLVEKLKRRSAVATTEESNEQKEQVDMKGLNKQALDPQKHEILGNVVKNVLSNIPGYGIPFGLGQGAGTIVGMVDNSSAPNDSKALGYVPGVGESRQLRRRRERDRTLSGGTRDRSAILHELAGTITTPAILAALGAGLGGQLSGSGHGVMLGGLAGAGTGMLANLGGGLAGLFTSTPDRREKYLKGSMAKNYLIPGYAAYQGASGVADVWNNGKNPKVRRAEDDEEANDTKGKDKETLTKTASASAYTFQALLLDGTIDMLRKRAAEDVSKPMIDRAVLGNKLAFRPQPGDAPGLDAVNRIPVARQLLGRAMYGRYRSDYGAPGQAVSDARDLTSRRALGPSWNTRNAIQDALTAEQDPAMSRLAQRLRVRSERPYGPQYDAGAMYNYGEMVRQGRQRQEKDVERRRTMSLGLGGAAGALLGKVYSKLPKR